MTSLTTPLLPPTTVRRSSATHALTFSVPARHNPRLQEIVERADGDEELRQYWRCANLNAGERSGLGDHGETHARIVANAGLRLLRLLLEAGHRSGVVEGHGLARADAEVVIVLSAALHDIGLGVRVTDPAAMGLPMAQAKAGQFLDGLYTLRERTALVSEVLHAIGAHHHSGPALTLEAAVLTVADVLDLSKGRLAASDGARDSVDAVHIGRGVQRPVRVEIRLPRASSLPAVVERLTVRLTESPLAPALEFTAVSPTGEAHHFSVDR